MRPRLFSLIAYSSMRRQAAAMASTGPNRRRAASTAESSSIPAAAKARARSSRWNASSSSTSRRTSRGHRRGSGFESLTLSTRSPCLKDSRYRSRKAVPALRLSAQLLPTGLRELVGLHPAVRIGQPPLRSHEATCLETMERGIERSFFDEQVRRCDLLDPPGDAVPVHRSPAERFEDQDPKRSLKEIDSRPFRHRPANLPL